MMGFSKQSRRFACVTAVLSLTFGSGFSSGRASGGIQALCHENSSWQVFDQKIAEVKVELAPWMVAQKKSVPGEAASRSIASVPKESATEEPSVEQVFFSKWDQEIWEKWTRARLDELHEVIDDVGADLRYPRQKEILAAFNKINQNLVRFHGYISDSRVEKFSETLSEIESSSQAARQLACSEGA